MTCAAPSPWCPKCRQWHQLEFDCVNPGLNAGLEEDYAELKAKAIKLEGERDALWEVIKEWIKEGK